MPVVCALNFDHKGNPWMASGQDGQFLKLNHDGKVLGGVGNGMGIGTGQFTEAISFAERAQQLIPSPQSPLAAKLQSMLETFRSGRPYRAD